ncbi:MAG: hypothetical protein KDA22_08365 [Phycisphaerales bacterium]|nr:hypothetical protein [Phycisphaerales bacterium]
MELPLPVEPRVGRFGEPLRDPPLCDDFPFDEPLRLEPLVAEPFRWEPRWEEPARSELEFDELDRLDWLSDEWELDESESLERSLADAESEALSDDDDESDALEWSWSVADCDDCPRAWSEERARDLCWASAFAMSRSMRSIISSIRRAVSGSAFSARTRWRRSAKICRRISDMRRSTWPSAAACRLARARSRSMPVADLAALERPTSDAFAPSADGAAPGATAATAKARPTARSARWTGATTPAVAATARVRERRSTASGVEIRMGVPSC